MPRLRRKNDYYLYQNAKGCANVRTMTSTLNSKGQITIPKAIRDKLELTEGDRLEFVLYPNGTLELIPKTHDISELQGILSPPSNVLTLEQMDEVIASVGEVDESES